MPSYVKFAPAITTTAALVGGLFVSADEIPLIPFVQTRDSVEILKSADFSSAITQYKIPNEKNEASKKIETIHKFASNLLENIEDLDPEFSKVIDENYWDLI